MELLRLRRRLALARRGHKLLQDKLEEMMRRFLNLLKEVRGAREDFDAATQAIFKDLLYCRLTTSKENFKNSLAGVESDVSISVSTQRILNVKVPAFNITGLTFKKRYDFFKTSAQLDIVVDTAGDYLDYLLRLAQLLKSLDILACEIERTRRRVNALEYILIPSIGNTISYITQKLSEFERGNLVRLMRIKEVLRSH